MVRVKVEVVVMARANATVKDKVGARDKAQVVKWGRDEACGMEADSAFAAMSKVGKSEAKANAAQKIKQESFLKRMCL